MKLMKKMLCVTLSTVLAAASMVSVTAQTDNAVAFENDFSQNLTPFSQNDLKSWVFTVLKKTELHGESVLQVMPYWDVDNDGIGKTIDNSLALSVDGTREKYRISFDFYKSTADRYYSMFLGNNTGAGFFGMFAFDEFGNIVVPRWGGEFVATKSDYTTTADIGSVKYEFNKWNTLDIVVDKTGTLNSDNNAYLAYYLNGVKFAEQSSGAECSYNLTKIWLGMNNKQAQYGCIEPKPFTDAMLSSEKLYIDNCKIAYPEASFDAVSASYNIGENAAVVEFSDSIDATNSEFSGVRLLDANSGPAAIGTPYAEGKKLFIPVSGSIGYGQSYSVYIPGSIKNTVGTLNTALSFDFTTPEENYAIKDVYGTNNFESFEAGESVYNKDAWLDISTQNMDFTGIDWGTDGTPAFGENYGDYQIVSEGGNNILKIIAHAGLAWNHYGKGLVFRFYGDSAEKEKTVISYDFKTQYDDKCIFGTRVYNAENKPLFDAAYNAKGHFNISTNASTVSKDMLISDTIGNTNAAYYFQTASYVKDRWYNVKIVIDRTNRKVLTYLNNEKVGETGWSNSITDTAASYITFFRYSSNDGRLIAFDANKVDQSLYIDNVKAGTDSLPQNAVYVEEFKIEKNGAMAAPSAQITNRMEDAINPVVIIAVYDGDKLIATQSKVVKIEAGSTVSVSANNDKAPIITIPGGLEKPAIKAFVWESINSIKPYADAVTE